MRRLTSRTMATKSDCGIKLFIVLVSASLVSSYSSGAFKGVCKDMSPFHGVEKQSSQSPFEIIVPKSEISGGEVLRFTLNSAPQRSFKGFLTTVKKSIDEGASYGKLELAPANRTHPENDKVAVTKEACSKDTENDGNLMKHSDPSKKTSIIIDWTPPNEDAEYVIYTTFVENKETFWTKVPSQKIKVKRDSQVAVAAAAAKPKAISQGLHEKLKVVYSECGVSKGCFAYPDGCISSFTDETTTPLCDWLLTWANKGGRHEFEMTAEISSGEYMALGFAETPDMGPSTVVGCTLDGQSVQVNRFYNQKRTHHVGDQRKLGLATPQQSEHTDGHLICRFEQSTHRIQELSKDFNFESTKMHPLIAISTGSSSGLGYHNDRRWYSPDAISTSDNIIIGAEASAISRTMIHLHGAFMIIAWLICASSGMFTARYLKLTHTDFMPFGKAFWFFIHVACMFTTFILTVAAIIIILVEKDGRFSNGLENPGKWHPYLGFVLFSLAILQVIIAFFRPHPNTPKRPLFNWIHWTIGNSAHIVGIACIFLAENLALANIDKHPSYSYVLGAFVAYHVFMHIIMSIHTVWADKQMDSNNKMRAVHPGPMKGNGLTAEAPGSAFRTFMLVAYIIGVAATAITLVVFVVNEYDGDSKL